MSSRLARHALVLVIGGASALGWGGPARALSGADEQAADRPDFTGRYGHVGGDAEKQAVQRSIRAATRSLFPGVRGIARRLLARKLPVAPNYEIEVVADRITIVGDDGVSRSAPPDGRSVRGESTDGENLQVRHFYRGNELVQLIASRRGARKNTYVLRPDTGELVIHVEVVSDELPQPIRYVLTYRRRR